MNPESNLNDRQQVKLLVDVQLDAGVDAEGVPLPMIEGKAGETYELYVGEASKLGDHVAEKVGDVIPGDLHTKMPPTLVTAPPPEGGALAHKQSAAEKKADDKAEAKAEAKEKADERHSHHK